MIAWDHFVHPTPEKSGAPLEHVQPAALVQQPPLAEEAEPQLRPPHPRPPLRHVAQAVFWAAPAAAHDSAEHELLNGGGWQQQRVLLARAALQQAPRAGLLAAEKQSHRAE